MLHLAISSCLAELLEVLGNPWGVFSGAMSSVPFISVKVEKQHFLDKVEKGEVGKWQIYSISVPRSVAIAVRFAQTFIS